MPHPALSKDTIIKFTGGEDLETLQSNDMLARMSLAAVKTPGVAEVFESLLGFEGDGDDVGEDGGDNDLILVLVILTNVLTCCT